MTITRRNSEVYWSMKKSSLSKLILIRQLLNIKMRATKPATSHFNTFSWVLTELSSHGLNCEEGIKTLAPLEAPDLPYRHLQSGVDQTLLTRLAFQRGKQGSCTSLDPHDLPYQHLQSGVDWTLLARLELRRGNQEIALLSWEVFCTTVTNSSSMLTLDDLLRIKLKCGLSVWTHLESE